MSELALSCQEAELEKAMIYLRENNKKLSQVISSTTSAQVKTTPVQVKTIEMNITYCQNKLKFVAKPVIFKMNFVRCLLSSVLESLLVFLSNSDACRVPLNHYTQLFILILFCKSFCV